ncbi:MAG: hypothetical protein ACH36H_06260 [Candidatus Nanopelagicales bacterium]
MIATTSRFTARAGAALLAAAAIAGLAGTAAVAAPAPATAVATATAAAAPTGALVATDQLQGVKGTHLVFRNVTDKTLMLYSPDGGLPTNSKEHYMATLSPGQEYMFGGYNTYGPNASDVYVRAYTVKTDAASGAVGRDTMVATVAAHNPHVGYPFIRVTAGKYWHDKTDRYLPHSRTMGLSEHETHDSWKVSGDTKFRAWVHRDGDVDGSDHKKIKVTLHDVDTTATMDFTGGGAAPA